MNYIDRMKEENAALDAKAHKLEDFMEGSTFRDMSVNARGLMALQLHLMAMYSGTLEERIELAEGETK